ncbi:hypothetical protein [Labrys monachus]|uniref:Uncharacterized protein n=1 Tax=Labrys monachus TaxID=217067 RepID=A0ABU0FH49_9HYPH|nr:hypothetical protein [Labrys monachus]MDQ0393449.1 hypothetical protein [Labrys monachus]
MAMRSAIASKIETRKRGGITAEVRGLDSLATILEARPNSRADDLMPWRAETEKRPRHRRASGFTLPHHSR